VPAVEKLTAGFCERSGTHLDLLIEGAKRQYRCEMSARTIFTGLLVLSINAAFAQSCNDWASQNPRCRHQMQQGAIVAYKAKIFHTVLNDELERIKSELDQAERLPTVSAREQARAVASAKMDLLAHLRDRLFDATVEDYELEP
jgi:hypothetical protein